MTPWGKLRWNEDQSALVEHSLLDHSVDVAAVLYRLTHVLAVNRSLSRAAKRDLNNVDRSRLAVLALLHDIGKTQIGFQVRRWTDYGQDPPEGWRKARHLNRGHSAEGYSALMNPRVSGSLPLAEMNEWGDSCLDLLLASLSHHGSPVIDGSATDSIFDRVDCGGGAFYDPAEVVAEISTIARKTYPQAFSVGAQKLPSTPEFSHQFAGLVQLADWLGSDDRSGFFEFSRPGEDRSKTAPVIADRVLRSVGLEFGDAESRRIDTLSDFSKIFQVPSPRPMQAAMADENLGPVVILEAETGSGKTEAALWRFLHLWRAGEVDALYFALPTRVAATQLYDRVQDFVNRTWKQNAPLTVRALPGYTAADSQEFSPIPDFKVIWHDNPDEIEKDRRWAAESPKRYLAAPISVGTIDQALLATLKVKHAHLRHALLSRSLLVIDEVHASDAYMTRLTEHLLRAHVGVGGHALLLSATLGAVARTRYLNTAKRESVSVPSLDQAIQTAYPSISHNGAAGPSLHGVGSNSRSKTVRWKTVDCIDDAERVAIMAIQAAEKGGRILVIRNTVAAAVATLRATESLLSPSGTNCLFKVAGVNTLHHSRFSKQDRPLLDAEVQSQIGKNRRPRPDGMGLIVIGTQTLEQSLDIDADLLITDLCPMDVLLQRIGRLHRHERHDRPAAYSRPQSFVLTPKGHDLTPMLHAQKHGLGPFPGKDEGIYFDMRVNEATRRLIDAVPERKIPDENRFLVEQSTHGEALDAIAQDMGNAWETHGHRVDGSGSAQSVGANLSALNTDKPFGEQVFLPRGEAPTRLGMMDRLITFNRPLPGPFGTQVKQIALPHYRMPKGLGLNEQPDPENVRPLPDQPGFQFTLGDRSYCYSRYGVEEIKD